MSLGTTAAQPPVSYSQQNRVGRAAPCSWPSTGAMKWTSPRPRDFAGERIPLSRRRRTPSSISYRPAPLHSSLPSAQLPLEIPGGGPVTTEATLFDFGGVSIGIEIPFQATAAELLQLADSLADADPLVRVARQTSERLFETLRPAIRAARWSELSEEYIVFRFAPGQLATDPADLRTASRLGSPASRLESAK